MNKNSVNTKKELEISIDERMQDTPMPKVIHSKTMDKNTIGLGSK